MLHVAPCLGIPLVYECMCFFPSNPCRSDELQISVGHFHESSPQKKNSMWPGNFPVNVPDLFMMVFGLMTV